MSRKLLAAAALALSTAVLALGGRTQVEYVASDSGTALDLETVKAAPLKIPTPDKYAWRRRG